MAEIISEMQDDWVARSGTDWYPSDNVIMSMLSTNPPNQAGEALNITAMKVGRGQFVRSNNDWLKYCRGILRNMRER